MDCQLCHAAKAIVHLTEILGPKAKRELHLCEACAQQHGTTGSEIMQLLGSASGATGFSESRRSIVKSVALFVGVLVVVTVALWLLGVDFKTAWGVGAIAAVFATVGVRMR